MTKKLHERNNRIAFPIQLFDDIEAMPSVKISDEIHVVPTGEWEHWTGETFSITSDTVATMVSNFNAGARKDIPITAGHDFGNESPAVGWFKQLIDRGVNGLYALVEWTEEGKRLMLNKSYKYFSAELVFDYIDLETGNKYAVLLTGGALTNKPFFKQLQLDPATFSEEQKNGPLSFNVPGILNQFNEHNVMDLATILAKAKADRTAEEAQFVVDHAGEMTDEQKASEAVVEGEGSGDGAGDDAGNGDGAGAEDGAGAGADASADAGAGADAGAEGADAGTKVDASEKGKKGRFMSEAEILALTERANKFDDVSKKLALKEFGEKFTGLTLSGSNPTGKFLPKQKDAVVDFMVSLSQKQYDQFVNIVNTMPAVKLQFGEIGDGASVPTEAKAQIDIEVKKLQDESQKSGKSLKYSDALRKVFQANPQLEKEYNETLLNQEEGA